MVGEEAGLLVVDDGEDGVIVGEAGQPSSAGRARGTVWFAEWGLWNGSISFSTSTHARLSAYKDDMLETLVTSVLIEVSVTQERHQARPSSASPLRIIDHRSFEHALDRVPHEQAARELLTVWGFCAFAKVLL